MSNQHFTSTSDNTTTGLEIAVIGMSGRFPGARNVDEFWENIKNGVESIRFFSTEELIESGISPDMLKLPNYIKAKGYLEDIDCFDAFFFDYVPREVERMDPQSRVLHECVWEALENAGYIPNEYNGLIGLYAGSSINLDWLNILMSGGDDSLFQNEALVMNFREYLCQRISYRFNLKGPTINIHTACSTSLTAVHFACQGLLNGECNMAVAGAVTVSLPSKNGYLFQEGVILSPDGHCRAFEANSAGTVFGNGAGVVVLKPLEDAINDHDTIRGVIKGSAVNNDGAQKIGFTAPGVGGQAAVIKAALYMAEVDPETIAYIETHGTGTRLGDPIEIEALTRAFDTDKKQFCPIGSVKTNLGHLETASGITGLIKTLLALESGVIPPTLHYQSPNPEIDFKNTPFYVNTKLTPFKRSEYPLRAGVSSFGIGSANVHVIVEEPPKSSSIEPLREYQLVLFSAKTPGSFERMSENLGSHFKKMFEDPCIQDKNAALADAAYTLQVGRKAFPHRGMFVCSSLEEAVDILSSPESDRTASPSKSFHKFQTGKKEMKAVFMFDGLEAQYVDMGRDLYDKEEVFRNEADRCFGILKPLLGYDLKGILYPPPDRVVPPEKMGEIDIAQLTIFILEYALARLVMSWGIKPVAMIGYSFGEYTAACIAGVISLEDTIRLIVTRGRLIAQTSDGAMLSVPLPVEQLKPIMEDELSIAIDNGPSTIVAGPIQAVERFEKQMKQRNLICMRLKARYAIHSKMMEPVVPGLVEFVKTIKLNQPRIPFVSNVTGSWLSSHEATDPAYWGRQIRQTAKFSEGLNLMARQEGSIFIEIGPGRDLSVMIGRRMNEELNQKTINLLRPQQKKVSDLHYLLSRLGWLWLYGLIPDWGSFYASETRKRIPLPTYPFERERYWPEIKKTKSQAFSSEEPVYVKKPDIRDWFYIPSWKRTVLHPRKTGDDQEKLNWLLFADRFEIGDRLAGLLQKMGYEVVLTRSGTAFSRFGEHDYTINPQQESDYESLIKELVEKGKPPRRIVYLWDVTGNQAGDILNQGAFSLLYLGRALESLVNEANIELTVITDYIQDVTGREVLYPEKSTILGAALTIPREYKNIKCRCIDIILPDPGQSDPLIDRLADELFDAGEDEIIAYRDNYRWVRTYEPDRLEAPSGEISRLKMGGVYLITGGLGGMGLELSKYLAETVKAKLILVNRRHFPPPDRWDEWEFSNSPDSDTALKIKKLRELEKLGASVMILSADVTQEDQLTNVIRSAEERFGNINGVIHAAGLAGGGLIRGRANDTLEAVLAPKVKGTLVLDSVLKGKKLDFFILCSSLITEVPTAGQVAYCTANMFLKHFAYYKTKRDNTFTVSIGWDGWQGVGNLMDVLKLQAGSRETVTSENMKTPHPFIEKYEVFNTNQVVFASRFDAKKLWALDEHRVLGEHVFPGTGYLELVRTALDNYPGYSTVVLNEVFFLSPLIVKAGEDKEVHTVIKQDGSDGIHFTFSVISRLTQGEDQWIEHARGKAVILPPGNEEKQHYNIVEREAECNLKESIPAEHEPAWSDRGGILWGPRWDNLKKIKFGSGCGIAVLELAPGFAQEVQSYKMHPALLDIATSILLGEDRYQGNFLPFFYKSIKINGNLPAKVVCFARAIRGIGQQTGDETSAFDIAIMDEQGNVLIDIEEFMLKKVDMSKTAPGIASLARPYSSFVAVPGGKMSAFAIESMKQAMQRAILPEEGVEVFRRVLASGNFPSILVSTWTLDARLKESRQSAEQLEKQFQDKGKNTARHSRPELRAAFIAPRTLIEKKMIQIWEELLGVDRLGIDDDFFELGGDSLIAVSFVARLHKELNLRLDISEFFKKPSVRELARWAETVEGVQEVFLSIEPAEKKEYYILSSNQMRMYTLQQFNPELISYNENFAVFMDGKLDEKHLQDVFYRLIRRHENLRTSFHLLEEQPIQRIHEDIKFRVEYYDLSHGEIKKEDFADQVIECLMKDFVRPFDLSKSPLFRVGLGKTPGNRYLLMMDMHHIITDLFSQALLFSDFVRLYQGENLEIPHLHYKDYCEWMNQDHRKQSIKKQEEFWLNQFKTQAPVLNLPADYPRPPVKSTEGNTYYFTLEKEDTDKVRKLAASHEATMYMTLLGLLNVLMAKLSGNEDIVFGTASSGRNHVDLQTMVGMFINVLCMRNFPAREKQFCDFLIEIKGRVLQASQNQDYQFEALVEKSGFPRDPSRHPIFDVGLELQGEEWAVASGGNSSIQLPGLVLKPFFYKNKVSRVDLLFFIKDIADHLEFEVEYSTRLFREETIRNFMNYFKTILSVVSNNPGKKIGEIEILPAEEIREMIEGIQEKNKEMDIEFDFQIG